MKQITKENLRIVFMGTPEFAVESLKVLVEQGYHVVAVVTQPDKAVGRHQDTLQPSDVKEYALRKGLPVLQPVKMKDPAFINTLASYHADLQVVVAFRMLPEIVWSMPTLGTFNVHAALLPQYRGAAPINWAVINGETKTGVTTFFLDQNIDTGRMIMQKELPIPDDADVEYVYDRLMVLGAEVCVETIDQLIAGNGEIASIPQDQLTVDPKTLHSAPKIFKETGDINWNQPTKKVYDLIRGLSPYPAAWTTLIDSETSDATNAQILKIYKSQKTGLKTDKEPGCIKIENGTLLISTSDEWLNITELQLAGKKRMSAKDFLNGVRDIDKKRAMHTL